MIFDLAANGGCTVFTAPDSEHGFISLFPLGGSLFEVDWHSSSDDALQANAQSVPGDGSGFWVVYSGAWPDCEIPGDVAPVDINILTASGGLPTDYVGGCVAPGAVYEAPPAKAVTVVWTAIESEESEVVSDAVPYLGSFRATAEDIVDGAFAPVIPSAVNVVGVNKPCACQVVLSTSVGKVVVPAGLTAFHPSDFPSGVDLRPVSVSGDCLEKVTVFVQSN